MFGIGMTELAVIMVIALIVIGPKNLPEIAKGMGRMYIQIQKTFREARSSITDEIDDIKREVDVPRDDEINKPDS